MHIQSAYRDRHLHTPDLKLCETGVEGYQGVQSSLQMNATVLYTPLCVRTWPVKAINSLT